MDAALILAIRACATALEQLAAALEQRSEQPAPPAPLATSSWPDFMTTGLAAKYCGFKTTGGLRKARLDGRISPAGRRGSRGSLTWARTDLDRFMRGSGASSVEPPPEMAPFQPPPENPKPPQHRSRPLSAGSIEALRRIKEIGKRGPR